MFFNPFSLLLLIPLAGLIVLMYILKLRRRDVLVSSTFLWQQVIRDVQANAPFQKLRKNLLLLLQLLAALLLVLIIARPFWRSQGIGGRSVVIVIDTSASMAASDVKPDRLAKAKEQAIRIVNEIKPEDQMMVVSAASRPEALTGFTGEKSELSRAINSLRVKETSTNIRDALNLSAALVATRTAARIEVLSDGAFPSVKNVNLGRAHVAFHPIGIGSSNVGIAAVDYRHSLAGEEKVQVFVTVKNYGATPVTCSLEIAHEKELLDAQEVELAAGAEIPQIFELPSPSQPVTLNVQLDAKDSLEADNRGALVINPRRTIKALLVGKDNPFLQNGINVDPNVELKKVALAGFRGPEGYDVVVFDGEAPKSLADGNYLFVNCSSEASPASPISQNENQALIDPDRAHPVLRYINFGITRWTTVTGGKPAPWARELASTESGAAIVAGERGRFRSVWTGFDLDEDHSRFPRTVAYPIFIANTLRWLARADDALDTQIKTGSPLSIDTVPEAKTITIEKPDGQVRDIAVTSRGSAVFNDVDQVGLYTVTRPGASKRVYAANLADSAESDITPRRNPDIGSGASGQPGRNVTVTREIWTYLAVLILGLLAFEWYAFHRRAFVN